MGRVHAHISVDQPRLVAMPTRHNIQDGDQSIDQILNYCVYYESYYEICATFLDKNTTYLLFYVLGKCQLHQRQEE